MQIFHVSLQSSDLDNQLIQSLQPTLYAQRWRTRAATVGGQTQTQQPEASDRPAGRQKLRTETAGLAQSLAREHHCQEDEANR